MNAPATARTLRDAARIQRGFGYLVGIAGSATGAILLANSSPASAAMCWAATFVSGAILVGIATALEGLAAILVNVQPSEPDTTIDGRFAT